jgi:hypothetical protein
MKSLLLSYCFLKRLILRKSIFLLVLTGVMLVSVTHGQTFNAGYDSLTFYKPSAKKMFYQFQDSVLKELTLHPNYPDYKALSAKESRKDLLLGVAALFMPGPFLFESEMDVIWQLSADLLCNNENLNWTVKLFCLGKAEEKREKSGEEGIYGYETTRNGYCDWENGSMGIILEKGDTIGWFSIIMDPKESPSLKPWSEEIYSQPVFPAQTASKNHNYWHQLNYPDIDYAITGQFRNNSFVLINNGMVRKCWFYAEQDLVCVFRPDVDFNRIKEQDRLMPYILLSSSIPGSENPDWYRLAIVSRFLSSKLCSKLFGY